MADISKKNVRGGGLPSSPFDWNSHTFTSTNFGAFLPVKTIRLRAGDSIKGNVHQQSWLAPLPAPVFGKFKNNTRAFFTKFSRIFKHYNDMLAGNMIRNPYGTNQFGRPLHVPYISALDIQKLFLDNCGFDSPQEAYDTGNYMPQSDQFLPSYLLDSKAEMELYNDPNLLCYPVQMAEMSGDKPMNPQKVKCDFKINFDNNLSATYSPYFNLFPSSGSYFNEFIYSQYNDSVEVDTDVYFNSSYVGFRFTRIGKLIYTLLLSLGYRFGLSYDVRSFPSLDLSTDDALLDSLSSLMRPVSILPLLGYVRTYMDWVLPSRYYNLSNFVDWRYFDEELQEYGCFDWQPNDVSDPVANAYPLRSVFTNFAIYRSTSFPSAAKLFRMLKNVLTMLVRSYYTEDYFMSAFSEMVDSSTSYGLNNTLAAPDDGDIDVMRDHMGDYGGQLVDKTDGSHNLLPKDITGAVIDTAKTDGMISQYQLLSIGRLQDMLLSGLIGGTKIQDWLKNEFGITPSKDSMMLTDYLGCDTQPVMIGDIYAMAASGNSPSGAGNYLGEVGGRGIINTQEGFQLDYSTNEDGFLYIVHELVSVPFYYQGLTDDVLETGKYDFYNPRFDGIGFDAVSHLEMFNFPITIDEDSQIVNPYGNTVFGFQPTYSRKKIPHDDLLGDFASPARNSDLLAWFVSRDFSRSSRFGTAPEMSQVIDMNWQSALADTAINDFDRIFYENTGYNDPIRSLFVFNLTKQSHMLPIKTSLDFTSGKDAITNNQGTILNN